MPSRDCCVPDEGRIVIDGRVVLDTRCRHLRAAAQRRAGYVFQDARLFPHMSVADNLRFGWRRAPQPRERRRDRAHRRSARARRICCARIRKLCPAARRAASRLAARCSSSPDILLLDEPLAALDAARRSEILPYLERLRDETKLPMIYVSHAVDEVARLADEIVVMRDGRVESRARCSIC